MIFKFCIFSTSRTMNYKIEKILFKFKKINDCVIVSITAKKRFYYTKTMTSEIYYQKDKTFEIKCE